MKYLGIDYGLKHIGLAISDGILAEPFKQLSNLSDEQSAKYLAKICNEEKIEQVIVGLSENQMAERTKMFVQTLKNYLEITITFEDETLSSWEAGQKLVQSGAGQKKRQDKKHQTAAAVILQNFLDKNREKML